MLPITLMYGILENVGQFAGLLMSSGPLSDGGLALEKPSPFFPRRDWIFPKSSPFSSCRIDHDDVL